MTNIWDPYVGSDPWSHADWDEVFGYAGDPRTASATTGPSDGRWEAEKPFSAGGFGRQDVVEILAAQNGDNTGPDWIMFGKLQDGRYFFVYAGCDYTGWGCGEGGGAYVSDDPDEIIRWAMTNDDRQRLGIALP